VALRRRQIHRDRRRGEQREQRRPPQRQRVVRLVDEKLDHREHAQRAEGRQQSEPAAGQVLRDVELAKLLLEEPVEAKPRKALVQLIRISRRTAGAVESRPLRPIWLIEISTANKDALSGPGPGSIRSQSRRR